jgi:hypothetical protein
MKVNAQNPQYTEALPKWQTCADAVAGQWAIHKAGTKYLPRLTEQTDPEYDAYVKRTSYFNATGRTLDGLIGMVMRKAPTIEASGLDKIIADIDLQDMSVDGLAEKILRQVMSKSRMGVLVEYPPVSMVGMTKAQADQRNLRPYASSYEAQTIINWRVQKVNNVMQPVLVVLQEEYNASSDEFEQALKPQLRVLRLVLDGEVIRYIQQIYQENEKKEWVQIGDDIVPMMNNAPLNFIPFYMYGAQDTSFNVQEPILLDLADLNLSHYRTNADYEHGCHFTGLPMLFLAGVTQASDAAGNPIPIHLGSQTAVVANDANADGKYIEFTGQGLGSLEKNLDRKENQMAAIGARMLEQQKNGVESEGAMQLRSNGETSVLAGVANLISGQMSKMLTFMATWYGQPQTVVYKLNTDYLATGITSAQLAELTKAYQSGAISFETYFENLQRGEIIRADRTIDEEKDLIADGGAPNGAE